MSGAKSCKVCGKNIGKRLKLFCGRCKGHFHLECGHVSELDARLMQEQKTPWDCEQCSRTHSTRRSTVFSIHSPSESEGIGELKSMMKEMQQDLRDMRYAMDFLNEKYEEEQKRTRIMSDMCSEIAKDNQLLKEKVQKLEAALNIQQNNKIKNNLCVSGLIKANEGKNQINEKLSKLFDYLSTPLEGKDIEEARHIETKNGSILLVTVATRELKEKILKARSQKGRISIRKVGLGNEDSSIYVSEELTKDTYSLFKKAKKDLKNKNFKYVWHKDGKVFARKQDGDRSIFIKNEEVLNDLLA